MINPDTITELCAWMRKLSTEAGIGFFLNISFVEGQPYRLYRVGSTMPVLSAYTYDFFHRTAIKLMSDLYDEHRAFLAKNEMKGLL